MTRLSVVGTARPHEVDVDERTLLVEMIRSDLDLTGTHIGCLTGDCGACTVRVDGKLEKACLSLAVAHDGAVITTIEGTAVDGELHPVQRAFWEEHGFQCGYCLPGMVLSAVDLLQTTLEPTEAEIREAIDGNLCRCTGYVNIVKAIRAAGASLAEEAAS
jgi:carbon-monoxide dehydrogenase small subunit